MSDTEGSKTEALLCWAAQVGISDDPSSSLSSSIPSSSNLGHSLVVSHFSDAGGRGLAASRNLRMGELILRVPRAALLTKQNVLHDEKLASCMNKHPNLSPSQVDKWFCSWQKKKRSNGHAKHIQPSKGFEWYLNGVAKGRGSWWYPYLVLLPSTYDTLLNFHEFEIQALQVEDAVWVSKNTIVKARSDWKESLIVMQEMKLKPQLLSFRSWLWASATISSRTLYIPWDDAGCLCPVGDLFNYAAPDDNSCAEDSHVEGNGVKELTELVDSHTQRLTDGGYEENSASYCFYAKRNYKKGEQVLLSYGTYSNLDLLEHYGFILSTNPNDKAFLQLDIDVNISNTWTKDLLYIQPDGKPSFALLCALRLGATPINRRRSLGRLAYAGFLLSNENEALVMKKLAKHCCMVLEKLPTTVKDDVSLLSVIDKILNFSTCLDSLDLALCRKEFVGFLQANGLPAKGEILLDTLLSAKALRSLERWRLAVQWRLCYKKILSNCISYCSKVMSEIS